MQPDGDWAIDNPWEGNSSSSSPPPPVPHTAAMTLSCKPPVPWTVASLTPGGVLPVLHVPSLRPMVLSVSPTDKPLAFASAPTASISLPEGRRIVTLAFSTHIKPGALAAVGQLSGSPLRQPPG